MVRKCELNIQKYSFKLYCSMCIIYAPSKDFVTFCKLFRMVIKIL